MNDPDDENDEDDYVEEKTDNEHPSAKEDGDNSDTDEPFPTTQSGPESRETGVVEGTLEEQVSDGEDTRDATDDLETVIQARNFDEARDRLSDGDGSNEDLENRDSPQEGSDIAQDEEVLIYEVDESVEEADVEHAIAEDPQEEEDLSEEQDDDSENEDPVQVVSETVTSGRRYREVRGTGVHPLHHGDPTSPRENDNLTDASEERASEDEDGSGSDDRAPPSETTDDDSQSSDELESEIIQSEEQANHEEPAEVDDNSDPGEHAGEQRSDREEGVEYDDPHEMPVEKIEEEVSESEEEDHELREEEGDTVEASDPNIVSGDGDGSHESAEDGSVDQDGRKSNESSDEVEKVEEHVTSDKSDDDDTGDEEEREEEPADAKAITDSGDSIDEGAALNVLTDQAPTSGISSPDDAEKAEEQVSTGESDEGENEDEEEGAKGETGNDKAVIDDLDEDCDTMPVRGGTAWGAGL